MCASLRACTRVQCRHSCGYGWKHLLHDVTVYSSMYIKHDGNMTQKYWLKLTRVNILEMYADVDINSQHACLCSCGMTCDPLVTAVSPCCPVGWGHPRRHQETGCSRTWAVALHLQPDKQWQRLIIYLTLWLMASGLIARTTLPGLYLQSSVWTSSPPPPWSRSREGGCPACFRPGANRVRTRAGSGGCTGPINDIIIYPQEQQ